MKVLIVGKTRRGGGACVGGIAWDGRSVRLIASDAAVNERAGLEYNLGEVWEVAFDPEAQTVPPHRENVIVRSARRLFKLDHPEGFIERHMPPVEGGPGCLFDGLLEAGTSGALYISRRIGLPERSTMFWRPDQPLRIDSQGKRIRYRYPTRDGGHTLTFVGFQEPVETIPAGTLLRVSLAHWWHPKDKPEEELRCYVQLSGWFELPFSPPPPPCQLPASAHRESDPKFDRARRVLKQTFGYSDFLPSQSEVVRRLLAGEPALVIMPTGGGKSLCYQLPALLFEGLTVVISPLIALMQDQVTQLRELGVPAAFLNSTLVHREYLAILGRVRSGAIKILYVAPETLLRPETLLLLEKVRLDCLAVDEAHCVSEWGHDFRPEYRQLGQVRRRFSRAVCVALTATATLRVRADIRQLLQIGSEGEFVASFNRPNLVLSVEPRRDALGQTLAFLEQHRDESGIIYCSTRQKVDELTAELEARGRSVRPYHAGLDESVRSRNQEEFTRDQVSIMVATVAFGMGINKSNVRFILHFNLPKDLESYYQEIGRAGRDGLPAHCLLLHSRADALTIRHFIQQGAPSERTGRQARLEAMIRYAETVGCRRVPLLRYFGEEPPAACGHCDHCLAVPDPETQTDVTTPAHKLLECARHTGERFGPAHLIAILRGSRSRKVIERRQDQLPMFATGRELSAGEWRELVGQLAGLGLIEQDPQFCSVKLTMEGLRVLERKRNVLVQSRPRTFSPRFGAAVATQPNRELFEKLRALRLSLARAAELPPYVIFSDRSLAEMAAHLPRDDEQFLRVHGVGEAKLANYGAAFLEIIRTHSQGQSPAPASEPPGKAPPPTRWVTGERRFEQMGRLFAQGKSLDEIAAHFQVQRGTVLGNLERYRQAGGFLDPIRLLEFSRLEPVERERVFRLFDEFGLARLAPLHQRLEQQVPYEELHLLRLVLRAQGK